MAAQRAVAAKAVAHWAARKAHVYVANSLMLAGANVDAKNLEESTPLHWAARKDHVELLRLLVAAGSSLTLCKARRYSCSSAWWAVWRPDGSKTSIFWIRSTASGLALG